MAIIEPDGVTGRVRTVEPSTVGTSGPRQIVRMSMKKWKGVTG